MAVTSSDSSFAVSWLVNCLQPLICFVTVLFASSLSLISLIIVFYDVMKFIMAENVALIMLFCVCVFSTHWCYHVSSYATYAHPLATLL